MKWYGYLAIPLTLLLIIVSVGADSFLDLTVGCLNLTFFMVVITSVLVAIDSTRIELRQYKTHVASHPFVLFLALLLLWIVVFPWYLIIRAKIQSGTLAKR